MRKKKSTFLRRQNLIFSSIRNNQSLKSKRGISYLLHSNPLVQEMSEVDRFDALKSFLSGNGYENSDGVFYIFPGKLLQAMMEVGGMGMVEA